MRFHVFVLALVLVLVFACKTRAGVLEDTCDLVHGKLASGPYESLTSTIEDFADDGKPYHGCVIRLAGNATTVTGAQRPDGLFGSSLPYCPDGKLPSDHPRDLLNKEGWCGDNMADGPDGTSYRAFHKNVVCAVEGRWDGGDDSDPSYVPSPRYEVIVKCANR